MKFLWWIYFIISLFALFQYEFTSTKCRPKQIVADETLNRGEIANGLFSTSVKGNQKNGQQGLLPIFRDSTVYRGSRRHFVSFHFYFLFLVVWVTLEV